ncbi:MAG: hypothetical protein IJF92_00510 [Bacilli bacterium]|nr:hypothetical protein [Bacilli bacterium]MBQ3307530.1 hypothetical protein [Bacilli bacterium]
MLKVIFVLLKLAGCLAIAVGLMMLTIIGFFAFTFKTIWAVVLILVAIIIATLTFVAITKLEDLD